MALNHHNDPNLTLNHLHTATNDASSSSSSSCRSFPLQDDQGISYAHPHEVVGDVALERKKEINDLKFTILKSCNQDHHIVTSYSPTALKMRFLQNSIESNCYYQTTDGHNLTRVDYSPKDSNGENSSTNNESCGLIRTCSDCGTTRTPLWRSGPHGPKSLCNACGIRQRKARRAAMAASDCTTCATNSNNNTTKLNLFKEMGAPKIMKKRSKNNHHARKTLTPKLDDNHQISSTHQTNNKKISFQEFALNLSKNLALHKFFQQDEKEAAILLMALSSGFVEG